MSETISAQNREGFDAAACSSSRSLLIFPTNSRQEMGRCTRRKLQEKNRALEANFAPAKRIKSKFGRCVVGRGIFPEPITSDAEWNAEFKALFDQWASNPSMYSVDGSHDFWESQRICAEEISAGDGEYFEAFTGGESAEDPIMMQHLDPFEIESGYGATERDLDDGVRLDPFMRVIEYAVRELPASGYYRPDSKPRTVRAENMVHVFRRRRAKQVRGIPPTYAGINDGHDALDFLSMAKTSAKLHQILAIAKTKAAGSGRRGVGGSAQAILDEDGEVADIKETFKGSGLTVELAENEKLELLSSDRPGEPVIQATQFYCELFALGADLPRSAAFSFAGVGGTPTRADLEDAQSTFDGVADIVICRHSQRIYTRFAAWAQRVKIIRQCKDPIFWAANWHTPAKLTVDYGRTAQANIDLVKNGMMSLSRYYEERGQDARTEIQNQIELRAWANKQCEDAGIEPTTIFEPTPGAVSASADPQTPADNNPDA